MRQWMMNDMEIQLVDYLNNHLGPIKKSLDDSFMNYEYVKVIEVMMDNDGQGFDIAVETYPGGRSLSWMPSPKKFLRKQKLDKIDGRK